MFAGKLTKIKEYPYRAHPRSPPYTIQPATILKLSVDCINVMPYKRDNLLMTLTDFHSFFFPGTPIDKLSEVLKNSRVNLFEANG